jgi:hypothetical protein
VRLTNLVAAQGALPEGMISLNTQLRSVSLALVALIGTALVLIPPSVAAASTRPPAAQTRAPMQPATPAPMQPTTPEGTPVLGPLDTMTSGNWSGYAASGTTFSSVSASWVVPTVTCTSGNQYSSSWVGLDGYNSGTVEQIGTDSDCASGAPSYYPWFEMYPNASYLIARTVLPGDQMNASVTATTATTFALTIADATQGWSRTLNRTLASAQLSSAEIIEEAPCCNGTGGILPLANFGVINFTNADANGQRIGTLTHQRINMAAGGVMKATTSALAQGAFSVTWDHG